MSWHSIYCGRCLSDGRYSVFKRRMLFHLFTHEWLILKVYSAKYPEDVEKAPARGPMARSKRLVSVYIL